jgi:hypothetical protein
MSMGKYGGLLWLVAAGLVALALAPLLVVAGEPALRRHRLAATAPHIRPRGKRNRVRVPDTAAYRTDLFVLSFAMHPLVIALTAPARWFHSTLMRSPRGRRGPKPPHGHERSFPDAPPFFGGVREPRRPNPAPPSDAVALRLPTGAGEAD